jgi:hypothetical protein
MENDDADAPRSTAALRTELAARRRLVVAG